MDVQLLIEALEDREDLIAGNLPFLRAWVEARIIRGKWGTTSHFDYHKYGFFRDYRGEPVFGPFWAACQDAGILTHRRVSTLWTPRGGDTGLSALNVSVLLVAPRREFEMAYLLRTAGVEDAYAEQFSTGPTVRSILEDIDAAAMQLAHAIKEGFREHAPHVAEILGPVEMHFGDVMDMAFEIASGFERVESQWFGFEQAYTGRREWLNVVFLRSKRGERDMFYCTTAPDRSGYPPYTNARLEGLGDELSAILASTMGHAWERTP